MIRLIAIRFALALLTAIFLIGCRRELAIWDTKQLGAGCAGHTYAVNSEPVDIIKTASKEQAENPFFTAFASSESGHIVTCSDGSTVLVQP